MKKIVIVAQGLNGGGAERVSSILANYLYDKGYEVMFIGVYNDIKKYYLNSSIRLEFIHTKFKSNFIRLVDRNIKVLKLIKKYGPDIIISFVTNEVLLSQLFFPVIHTLRNDPNKNESSIIESLLRKIAYSSAHTVVFQTRSAMQLFSKKIKQKGVVIYNPLDLNSLPSYNFNNNNKTFITASRLCEQKNIKLLINSFYEFHKSFPEFNLNIYGEGPLYDELNDLIISLGSCDYISLCDFTNDIHTIMKESYAFVLSSDYEGLSNSMLEALCIGIPCIVTDSSPGGAREFIIDGQNGFLTPVNNKEEMVSKMLMLVNNRDYLLRSFYKKNAKTREMVNLDNVCNQWIHVIESGAKK